MIVAAVSLALLTPQVSYSDVIASYANNGDFMGTAVVMVAGEIIFEGEAGHADIEHGVKNSQDSRFGVASITKTLTAAAILKLQDEGKLEITDKLSKFLPGLPNGDDISVRLLLMHAGGVDNPDYE
ncbi:MAG: beta-lactamase family protein, partial [Armatimonadetes bacterium]|nr:beta-lactamase family protein [Armatimonadota bacterium]